MYNLILIIASSFVGIYLYFCDLLPFIQWFVVIGCFGITLTITLFQFINMIKGALK